MTTDRRRTCGECRSFERLADGHTLADGRKCDIGRCANRGLVTTPFKRLSTFGECAEGLFEPKDGGAAHERCECSTWVRATEWDATHAILTGHHPRCGSDPGALQYAYGLIWRLIATVENGLATREGWQAYREAKLLMEQEDIGEWKG